MSMHLEGPWLTTTGKKKGKRKYRNADQARKARQLEEEWKALKKKWGIEDEQKKKRRAMDSGTYVPTTSYRRETERIPSLPFSGAPCLKTERPVYTGTLIKGIATMHKSNAVPVISDEQAVEISKMRR